MKVSDYFGSVVPRFYGRPAACETATRANTQGLRWRRLTPPQSTSERWLGTIAGGMSVVTVLGWKSTFRQSLVLQQIERLAAALVTDLATSTAYQPARPKLWWPSCASHGQTCSTGAPMVVARFLGGAPCRPDRRLGPLRRRPMRRTPRGCASLILGVPTSHQNAQLATLVIDAASCRAQARARSTSPTTSGPSTSRT